MLGFQAIPIGSTSTVIYTRVVSKMVRLACPKTIACHIEYDENEFPIQHPFCAISEIASNAPSLCIDDLLWRATRPDADETTHTCRTITNDVERQQQKHVAGVAAQSTSR